MFKVIFRERKEEIIVIPFDDNEPMLLPSEQATEELIEHLASVYESYTIITMPDNTQVEIID